MDYLQDEVLGSKHAMSTTSLSLVQKIDIREAEKLIEQFWRRHQNQLTAAYKCKTVEGHRVKLKIVRSEDLSNDTKEARIYLICVSGTLDNAAFSEVAGRCRDVQSKSVISDLENTGMSWNPLLDHDFNLSTQSVFGPKSSSQKMSQSASRETKQSLQPTVTAAKPVKREIPEKQSNSKTVKSESDSKTKPDAFKKNEAKPKNSIFPFQKVDKATALKKNAFNRKPSSKPVPEKVVVAPETHEDVEMPDDNDDDNEKDETRMNNQKSREKEMRNSENSFNTDVSVDENKRKRESAPETSEEENDTIKSQSVKWSNRHENDITTRHTETDECSPSDTTSTEKIAPELSEKDECSVKEEDQKSAPKNKKKTKNITIDPNTGRKMRVIKKLVTVPMEKDEEGYSVMGTKMEDVLVECDDEGVPINREDQIALEESNSAENELPTAETKNIQSSKATQLMPHQTQKHPTTKSNSGKQDTLLNYFNVMKKN